MSNLQVTSSLWSAYIKHVTTFSTLETQILQICLNNDYDMQRWTNIHKKWV
jgi:hypothetical protein